MISEEEIYVCIYSYSDFFHIEDENPMIFQTADNKIVSLHSNVTTTSGSSTLRIEPLRKTHRQVVFSNLALVGGDPWTNDVKVKRATFNVRHTEQLMHHKAKVRAIGNRRFATADHFEIFAAAADGMVVGERYSATYDMTFDAPKEFWPSFEIEFDDPRDINDYITYVSDYVGFLSFCLGVKLKPSAIRVNRLSFEEVNTAIESDAYRGDYEAHYVWPEADINSQDRWVGGSPVRSWDDRELAALKACLVVWMNRASAWRRPCVLMMTSFGLKNEISAVRLINACRWFEEIPIAQIQDALSAEDVDSIAAAASEKANDLGHHPNIRKRIEGAIKGLKSESTEARFIRLTGMIELKFGHGILPENAVEHLKRAIRFRGKCAHGHFNPESDAEFRAFSKSIRAMEALCFLLTAYGLPIIREGIERVRSNPLVREYHWAYD